MLSPGATALGYPALPCRPHLTGRLLLQAEAPGKDVDWGPLEVNRIIGSLWGRMKEASQEGQARPQPLLPSTKLTAE